MSNGTMTSYSINYPVNNLSITGQNSLNGIYSLFLINGNYTGPIINVRRNSDGATSDFYGDYTGNLSTSIGSSYLVSFGITISSWLNSSTGYISIWYDQSGRGNHATQTTILSQPQIYLDPSGNNLNNSVYFSNSTSYMSLPDSTIPSVNTNYSFVFKHGILSTTSNIILGSGTPINGNNTTNYLFLNGNTYDNSWYNNDLSFNGYVANNTVSITYNNSTQLRKGYINGNLIKSATSTTSRNSSSTNNYIGNFGGGISYTATNASQSSSGNYTLITFNSTGSITFTSPVPTNSIGVLIVGGGGAGYSAGADYNGGNGGGGGGGVGIGILNFSTFVPYNITIGNGGVSTSTVSTSGINSSIVGGSINEVAYGGGGGDIHGYTTSGFSGGSGGGGSTNNNYPGGSATKGSGTLTYYGNNGGAASGGIGGGGGGATSAASTRNGGQGYLFTINGVVYGSGGGGGGFQNTGGTGGTNAGVGGNGSAGGITSIGGNGVANTGGGGGGISRNAVYSNSMAYQGGYGGSGIVIIYFLTNLSAVSAYNPLQGYLNYMYILSTELTNEDRNILENSNTYATQIFGTQNLITNTTCSPSSSPGNPSSGSLALNGKNNYVSIPTITTPTSSGLSVGFWVNVNSNCSSFAKIFDFDDVSHNHNIYSYYFNKNIFFGIIDNSANNFANTYNFGAITSYTQPFGTYLSQQFISIAISNNIALAASWSSNLLYYSTFNGTSWTTFAQTLNTTAISGQPFAVCFNGTRGLVASKNGYVYFMTWNGTNFSTLTQILDTTSRVYTGIQITSDGTIITAIADYVYYSTWNGTNYSIFTKTLDTVQNTSGTGAIKMSSNGNLIVYNKSGLTNISIWNGQNYTLPIQTYDISNSRIIYNYAFSSDLSILWMFSNTGLNYALWTGSNYSAFSSLQLPQITQTINTLYFNSSSQYGTAGAATNYAYNTGSIEVWIKTSAINSSYAGIVVKQSAYGIFIYNNYLTVYNWSTAAATTYSNIALNDNNWHYIVYTFSTSGTSYVYLDGTLVLTINSFAISNQNQSLIIGNSTGYTQPFNGYITNIKIWNIQVSQTYVSSNTTFNTTLSPTTTGLTGFWKMSEATGTTLNNSVSGGTNITLTGTPTWLTSTYTQAFNGFGLETYTYNNTPYIAFCDYLNSKIFQISIPILKTNVYKTFLNNTKYNISTPITPSTWTYLLWTIDTSNNWNIYKNGSLIITLSNEINPSNFLRTLNYIGAGQNGQNDPLFSGYLDEFRLYTKTLSQSEINILSNTNYINNLLIAKSIDGINWANQAPYITEMTYSSNTPNSISFFYNSPTTIGIDNYTFSASKIPSNLSISQGLNFTIYNGYFNSNVSFFLTASLYTGPFQYWVGEYPNSSIINTGTTSTLSSFQNATGNVSLIFNSGYYLNNLSVQWTGYFLTPSNETGTWTFNLSNGSNGISYLWLGDTANQGYTTNNCLVSNSGSGGTVNLNANTFYPIRIQYGQNTGYATFSLSIKNTKNILITNTTGYFYPSNYYLFQIQNYSLSSFNYKLPSSSSSIQNYSFLPILGAYARYQAKDYNITTNTWNDSTGNGRNLPSSQISAGGLTITTNSGNGSTQSFTCIQGTTSTQIQFTTSQITQYTLFYVARYTGTSNGRILQSNNENWLSGFWSNTYKCAYHSGTWITGQQSSTTNWLLTTDSYQLYRGNGYNFTTAGGGASYLPSIGINVSGEQSTFQFVELLIFNSYLTAAQIITMEQYLATTYGITEAITNIGSYSGLITTLSTTGKYLTTTMNNLSPSTNYIISLNASNSFGTSNALSIVASTTSFFPTTTINFLTSSTTSITLYLQFSSISLITSITAVAVPTISGGTTITRAYGSPPYNTITITGLTINTIYNITVYLTTTYGTTKYTITSQTLQVAPQYFPICWYDSADTTTLYDQANFPLLNSYNSVYLWKDKTYNGNDLYSISTGNNTYNGKYITTNNTSTTGFYTTTTPYIFQNGNISLFYVFQPTGNGTGGCIFSKSNSSIAWPFQIVSNSRLIGNASSNLSLITQFNALTASGSIVLLECFLNSNGNTYSEYLNGSLIYTYPNNTFGFKQITTSNSIPGLQWYLYSGNYNNSVSFFNTASLQQDICGNNTGTTTSINFSNTVIASIPSASTNFSIMYVGYLYTQSYSGSWTFTSSNIDDCFQFWIGSNLTTNITTSSNITGAQSYSITLSANTFYPIVLLYGQGPGGWTVSFSITPPGGSATTNGTGFFYNYTNVAVQFNAPSINFYFSESNNQRLYISNRSDNASWASLNLCEIVLYNTAISTNYRQQVEGWLMWKWGIQSNLPSNHPYYLTAPLNPIFNQVPNTPLNFAVSSTTLNSITIVFNPPTQPVLYYTLITSGVGTSITNTISNGSPYTVSGLTFGITYTFSLTATNSYGTSSATTLTSTINTAALTSIPAYPPVCWYDANDNSTVLTQTASTQSKYYFDTSKFSSSVGTPANGLFACTLINTAYTGPIFNIQRSSDNLTSDFYSDISGTKLYQSNGTLLPTWLNGSIPYVMTWYDQSGRGNNATAGNPPIFNFISYYVDFTNGGYLNLPTGTIPYNNSSYTVITKHNIINNSYGTWLSCGSNAGNQMNDFRIVNGNQYQNSWSGNDFTSGTYAPNNVVSFKYISSTNTSSLYVNSTLSLSSVRTSPNQIQVNPPNYIGYTQTNQGFSGQLYYLYIYPVALTDASRQFLEASSNFVPSSTTYIPASNGNVVFKWTDKSINGYDLYPYPRTYALNNIYNNPGSINGILSLNNSIFTGNTSTTGFYTAGTSPLFPTGIFGFCVFQPTGNGKSGYKSLISKNNSPFDLTNNIFTYNAYSNINLNTVNYSYPILYEFNYNVINSTFIDYLNGTVLTTDTSLNMIGVWLDSSNTSLYIANNQNNYYNSLYLCEIILYNANQITTTFKQQVEGWLAWKWGIQSYLPSTHLYYNASPVNNPIYSGITFPTQLYQTDITNNSISLSFYTPYPQDQSYNIVATRSTDGAIITKSGIITNPNNNYVVLNGLIPSTAYLITLTVYSSTGYSSQTSIIISTLSYPVAWYDATDISTVLDICGNQMSSNVSGTSVYMWKDKSFNNYHLYANNLSGLNAITYSGNNITINNPNFTNPSVGGSYSYLTTIPSWTIVNGSSNFGISASSIWEVIPFPSGSTQALYCQTNGSAGITYNIYQSITFSSVGYYTLSFYTCGRSGYSTTNTLSVSIGSNILVSSYVIPISVWTNLIYTFNITTPGNYNLTFSFINTASTDSTISITLVNIYQNNNMIVNTANQTNSNTFRKQGFSDNSFYNSNTTVNSYNSILTGNVSSGGFITALGSTPPMTNGFSAIFVYQETNAYNSVSGVAMPGLFSKMTLGSGVANPWDMYGQTRTIGNGTLTNTFTTGAGIYPGRVSTTTPAIIEIMYDNTNSVLYEFYNGQNIYGIGGVSNTYFVDNSNALLYIANRGDSTSFHCLYLCEMIFYNTQLSNINRQIVEGWLAWKWGIQGNLQSNHPYYLTPPLFNPIDPSIPNAPSNFQYVSATNSSITFTFTPPLKTLDYYTITASPMPTSLILYYNFDISGSSGILNYATGTGISNTSIVGSEINISNSIYSQGTGSLYSVNPNSNYLSLSTLPANVSGYTFSFWINISVSNFSGMVFSFNNSTTYYCYVAITNGQIKIGNSLGNYTLGYTPTPGTWVHFAWSFTKLSVSSFYINGVLFGNTNKIPYSSAALINNRIMGDSNSNTNGFNGYLDEFVYYDGILSSSTIYSLYQNSANILSYSVPTGTIVSSNVFSQYSPITLTGLTFGVQYNVSIISTDLSGSSSIPATTVAVINNDSITNIPAYSPLCWYDANDNSTVLTQIASAQSNYYFDTSQFSSSVGTPANGLFACTLINTAYTGPIFNIQRSSDNLTSDFYSDISGTKLYQSNGTLLPTWLNGSIPYVMTWYDQSGRGNNATAGNPPIFNFISYYVDFTNGGYLNLPTGTIPYNNSSYTVITKHNIINNSYGTWLSCGSNAGNQMNDFRIVNGNQYQNSWSGNDFTSGTYAPNNVVSFKYISSTNTSSLYVNSTLSLSSVRTSPNQIQVNPPNYIGYTQTGQGFSGQLYYLYIYPVALTDASRQFLEASSNFVPSSTTYIPASNGNPIMKWSDKSINVYDLYPISTTYLNSNIFNAAKSGNVSGLLSANNSIYTQYISTNVYNGFYTKGTSPLVPTGVFAFCVFQPIGKSNSSGGSLITKSYPFDIYSNSRTWGNVNATGTTTSNTNIASSSVPYLFEFNLNVVQNSITEYVNGILKFKNNTLYASSVYCDINYSLYIANRNDNTKQNSLYLCEIVLYNSSIVSTQFQQQVEGWLSWKWNIQNYLPVSHPYKNYQPSFNPLYSGFNSPTGLTINNISQTKISLNFNPPSGTSIPISYIATATDNTGNIINFPAFTSTTSPIYYTLTGLISKTSYLITITAFFQGGYTSNTSIMSSTSVPLNCWYDAADTSTILNVSNNQITTSNTYVNSWADKSGNGYKLYSINSSLNTFNNVYYNSMLINTIITPNASNGGFYTNGTSPPMTNGFTAFFVYYPQSQTALLGGGLFSKTNTSNVASPWDMYGTNRYISNGTNGNIVSNFNPTNNYNNNIFLYEAYFNPSTQYFYETINANGQYAGYFNSSYADSSFPLYIANRRNNDTYANLFLSEIIFFNSLITPQHQQLIEGYLCWKWGIQNYLPSGHPYRSIQPPNTYDNQIPTPPTNITVSNMTSTTATIGFQSPTQSIIYYTITAISGSNTIIQNAYSSPYTITGLTNGSIYSVSITSTNLNGTSTASNTLSITLSSTYIPPYSPVCWYDASDNSTILDISGIAITTNGKLVYKWKDKSTNANHLYPTSATSYDYFSAPGNVSGTLLKYNSIYTTSNSGLYTYTNVLMPTGVSGFIVYQPVNANTNGTLIFKGPWNAGPIDIYSNQRNIGNNSNGITTISNFNVNTFNNSSPYLYEFNFSAINSTFNEYINTILQTNTSVNYQYYFDVNCSLYLSCKPYAGYNATLYLCEVVLFNTQLTQGFKQQVQGWLMWKWGLQSSLPQKHPYKSSPPATNPINTGIPPPTNLSVINASTTTLDISFTPPSGQSISSYTVVITSTSNTTITVQTFNTIPYAITGLSSSTTYLITLTALSTTGYSSSASIIACTIIPPSCWYDANDTTTLLTAGNVQLNSTNNNLPIYYWKDKSGGNYTMNRIGSSLNNIFYTSGGIGSVLNNSTNINSIFTPNLSNGGFSSTGSPNMSSGNYAFIVYQPTGNSTGGGTLFSKNNSSYANPINIYGTTRVFGNGTASITSATSTFNVSTSANLMLFESFTDISSNYYSEYINGNTTATYGSTVSMTGYLNSTNPLYLANSVSNNSYNSLYLCEIVMFNVRTMTFQYQQLIEGWLAWKWRLPLPSGHPYQQIKPTYNPFDVQVPYPPTNIYVLSYTSSSSVLISFQESTNIIYYTATAVPTSGSTITQTTNTNIFTISGLSFGTTYSLTITATNLNGTSVASSAISITITTNNLSNPPLYSPTCWYDVSDNSTLYNSTGNIITTNSTSVYRWKDKSTNGYDLYTIGSSVYYIPGGAFSKIPCINTQTNTSAGFYTKTNPTFNTGLFGFIVYQSTNNNTTYGEIIFKGPSNGTAAPIDFYASNRLFGNGNNVSGNIVSNINCTNANANSLFMYEFNVNIENSSFYEYINGNQYTANTSVSYNSYLDSSLNTLCICNKSYTGGSYWSNNYLCEIVLFNGQISVPFQQHVEGWLAWKWGIQAGLSITHPYKNTRPSMSPLASVPQPTNLAVMNSTSNSLYFTFNPPSGQTISSYTILATLIQSNFTSPIQIIQSFSAPATSYTMTGLSPKSTYTFVLTAFLSNGFSSNTSIIASTATPPSCWYDANDTNTIFPVSGSIGYINNSILNNTFVNTWNDKSGNGCNLTSIGGSTINVYNTLGGGDTSLTYYPSVFTPNISNTGFNSTGSPNMSSGNYAFVVYKPTGNYSGSGGSLFSENNSSYANPIDIYGTSRVFGNGTASITSATSTFNIASSTSLMLFESFTDISSNYYSEYINGNTTATYGATVSMTGYSSSNKSLYLANNVVNKYNSLYLCEVVMFNVRTMTIQYQQIIEGWLAWKWGLQSTLPSGHPYQLVKPTYNPYDIQIPYPPTNLFISGFPSSTTAQLAFTTSPNQYIINYTVSITPSGGSTTTQTAYNSPYTITGLSIGTIYSISITATNLNGTSSSSTAISITMSSTFIPSYSPLCWYDASDNTTILDSVGNVINTNGTAVSRWNDKSMNGYHLFTIANTNNFSAAGNVASGALATRNSIFTQNTSTCGFYTKNTSPPIPTGFFAFFVFQKTGNSSASGGGLISKYNSTSTNPFPIDFSGTTRNFGNNSTSTTVSSNLNLSTSSSLFLYSCNYNLQSQYITDYVNGNLYSIYNISNFASNFPYIDSSFNLYVANRSDNARYNSTFLCEIVIYNTQISQSFQQQVEGWLAWKWNIQSNLPANHPFKYQIPNTTPIYSGIAPPTNLFITSITSTTISVSFVAPTQSVANYTINAMNLNGNIITNTFSSGTTYTITGLTSQTLYFITLIGTDLSGNTNQISVYGTTLFSPTCWYDANDTTTLYDPSGALITTNAKNVNIWNDKSGNGYHLYSINSANTTFYTQAIASSYKSILLSTALTAGFYTKNTSPQFTNYLYGFFVIQPNAGNTAGTLFSKMNGSIANPYYKYSNNITCGNGSSNTNALTTVNIASNASIYLYEFFLNKTTSTFYEYKNGVSQSTTTNASLFTNYTENATNPFILGNNSITSGNENAGYYCEVVLYNTAITTGYQQQIEGWLCWKWGIQTSLPTNHPYYIKPPSYNPI